MDPMEQIWEKIATPDATGEKVVVYKGEQDLVFLYANGLVDADQYGLEEWVAAFADSRQKDGTYRLTHEQWMAKKKFRYNGPVHKPFDPQRLKDGEYTPEEFYGILKEELVPSTWLTEQSIPKVMKNYQAAGKFKDGKFVIDQALKDDFEKILRFYPSPLRILQIDVHGLPTQKKLVAGMPPASVSGFVQGTEMGREAARALEALYGRPAAAQPTAASQTSQAASTTLKDLMKKRKTPPSKGRV